MNQWQIVIFMVGSKANHVALSIPEQGLADLSLRGARVVSWNDRSLPKGEPLFFGIHVPEPDKSLVFLRQPGLLTGEIIRQEKASKGWHLTDAAPDFILSLRSSRSRQPSDMNCVEWIVRALEIGGVSMPMDVLTPEHLLCWCEMHCVRRANALSADTSAFGNDDTSNDS